MHSTRITSVVFSVLLLARMASLNAADVTNLRCESLVDPLGIDEAQPRLSWIIDAPQSETSNSNSHITPGVKQSVYQVLVASTPELLAKDQGDLWDSGKVESDQSVHVEYQGKPLASGMQCFWKVKVRTMTSATRPQSFSSWSNPATWTMGVLKLEDWGSAKWIMSDLVLFDYQKELKKKPDQFKEKSWPMWERCDRIREMTAIVKEAPAVWLRKEFSATGKRLKRARDTGLISAWKPPGGCG
jgi:alpha-L-rhamnosidase